MRLGLLCCTDCRKIALLRNREFLHWKLYTKSLICFDHREMGKKWRNEKRKKGNWSKPPRERNIDQNYVAIIRENKDFENFYKKQNIVPVEKWDSFMSTLKTDLPSAFRITGSKSHAKTILRILRENYFTPLKEAKQELANDEKFEANCLPWYPEDFGWQLNLTRKDIRRHEAYWRLHQFLISETETGNISRQEAVSMIPPLLLNVRQHHKVLDMCAAPGSKTAQIIEYLHHDDISCPEGIVIANDADNKRCYMLTHQTKRIQSPTLMITNHDAAFMPNINHTRADGSVGPLKFDRILCDVPCTGDGTLRKNFDVWSKWNAANGPNLHGLQLRIARRGLEMLAVGGRMIYSTCSLNPMENEAVVNRLLEEFGDSIALVDVSKELPGLKFTPGLSHWVVMNRELEVIPSADQIPTKNENLLSKKLFPPTEEEKSARKLERCIRLLPHQQNTGGFFVAVFEKAKPLLGEKIYKSSDDLVENEIDSVVQIATQRTKKAPKKRRRGFKEEPFFYLNKESDMWTEISKFYQFKDDFDASLFLRRTEDGKGRSIYFTNAMVKDIVNLNHERVKIINTGVKVLVKCDNLGSECLHRLAQEGSRVLLPFFTGRKIKVQRDDLIKMLMCDDESSAPISELDSTTQNLCSEISSGSCVFTYKDEKICDGICLELVGWKGMNSVRAYIAKTERVHYLRLLEADVSHLERNKFQEQRDLEKNNNVSENDLPKEVNLVSTESI